MTKTDQVNAAGESLAAVEATAARLNLRDVTGRTRLACAVDDRDWPRAERLLGEGASPNVPDNDGNPPFFHAARSGELRALEMMDAHDVDWTHMNKDRENVWHFAARSGNAEVIDWLNEQGKAVLSKENAAIGLQQEVPLGVKAPNVHDKDPLRAAVDVIHEHGHEKTKQVLMALKRAGVDFDAKYLDELVPPGINLPPVYEVALEGSLEKVQVLVESGAYLYVEIENEEYCVLPYAIQSGNPDLVRYLVELGPDFVSFQMGGDESMEDRAADLFKEQELGAAEKKRRKEVWAIVAAATESFDQRHPDLAIRDPYYATINAS